MSRKLAGVTTAMIASALLLGGCAFIPGFGETDTSPAAESPTTTEAPAEPPAEEPKPEEPPAVEPQTEEPPEVEPEPTAPEPEPAPEAPAIQAESCAWDSPAVAGDPSSAPSGPGDALETALIGAWQHTHIDGDPLGAGIDIRYVFPSTSRMLYCQDVAGATSQAENAADISLDGTTIVLPGAAPGFTITAWSANTLVWTNNRDGTTYLLQRR